MKSYRKWRKGIVYILYIVSVYWCMCLCMCMCMWIAIGECCYVLDYFIYALRSHQNFEFFQAVINLFLKVYDAILYIMYVRVYAWVYECVLYVTFVSMYIVVSHIPSVASSIRSALNACHHTCDLLRIHFKPIAISMQTHCHYNGHNFRERGRNTPTHIHTHNQRHHDHDMESVVENVIAERVFVTMTKFLLWHVDMNPSLLL